MVVAPDNYPYKKYRGKYCYEHILVYWLNYGDIPVGYEIHHKDKNKRNNDPDNLEMLTSEEHRRIHTNERKKTMVKLKCPSCESIFTKHKRKTHLSRGGNLTFCSKQCVGKFNFRCVAEEHLEYWKENNVINIYKECDGLLVVESIQKKPINDYVKVYRPNHPRAMVGGEVYEHILVAEEYLGRTLGKGEVVHHEDSMKSNNSQSNLYVFKTKSDHIRYLKTGERIYCNDGSYISPKPKGICSSCGMVFDKKESKQTFCNRKCANEHKILTAIRKVERPSKEELLALIHSKSFRQIGRDYGVSDNAIRKWCKSYGLPHRVKDINDLKRLSESIT